MNPPTATAPMLDADELRAMFGEPGTDEIDQHPNPGPVVQNQLLLRQNSQRAILDAAEQRGDGTLRASEQRAFDAHQAVVDLLRLYEPAVGRRSADAAAAFQRAGLSPARVRSEPVTYHRESRASYFSDLFTSSFRGDHEARQRLERHAQEMQVEHRDLNRTDNTGGYFVPPLWLSDYVELARAGRPTANLVTNLPLPPGTDSINVPKISTGTATAIQTADNSAVQETDLADTSVACGVKTIAGQQDLAIQLLEQSPYGFDQVVFADLAADYATKVDVQVLSGSNAGNQVKGIYSATGVNTVAFTDTTPTVTELYPKIADAIQKVHTGRFLEPTVIVMHPRRWAWFTASLDSQGRPLVVPNAQGANNAIATFDGAYSQRVVGSLQGLPVVTDPSIPITDGTGTNEDSIIVMRAQDCVLYESSLRTRILPEVGSGTLTVRLQVYGYLAFTAERQPKGITIVSGAGLAAPSW